MVKSRSRSGSAFGRLAAAGAIAAAVAVVADVVVYWIGRAVGASMVMPFEWGAPPALLPIGTVVSTVLVAAIVATITLGLVTRFTVNGKRNFQIVSVLVLLVSLAAPFSLPQTDGSTIATLIAMHLVAATGIITVLSLLAPPSGRLASTLGPASTS